MREVKIPDSLKPENIMNTIEEREKMRQRESRMKGKKTVRMTVAAAMAVCCVGGSIAAYQHFGGPVETGDADGNDKKIEDVVYGKPKDKLDSYDQLYTLYKEYKKNSHSKGEVWYGNLDMNMTVDGSIMDDFGPSFETEGVGDMQGTSESVDKEYSGTNVQTEGIDESDWVKTDGEYIYYVHRDNKELEIIHAKGAESELVAEYDLKNSIETEGNISVGECYFVDDTLVVELEQWGYAENDGAKDSFGTKKISKVEDKGWIVQLDLEDKSNPVTKGFYEYQGEVVNSRLQDDIMYIVTRKAIDYSSKKTVPMCMNGEQVDASEVYIMDADYYDWYTGVATLDISDGMKMVDSFVYASDGNPGMYMSNNAIYLYTERWVDELPKEMEATGTDAQISEDKEEVMNLTPYFRHYQITELVKVQVNELDLEFNTKTFIEGAIDDQFSMDEYNGYLRLVYTDNNRYTNVLHIMDENLKTVGKIDNIADGESIYSARFQGDLGYFVTFRQTDPLFCVDLSDPHNPVMLGYLKIPGYSSYLHPINDDTMFGLGYEDGFLKVSLFDVSDSADMKETQVVKLESYTYAEAADNHKALMVAEDNQVFGFYMEGMDSKYIVMQYGEGQMNIVEEIQFEHYYDDAVRGVQCGDYLYVFTPDSCTVYTMDAVIAMDEAEEIAELVY